MGLLRQPQLGKRPGGRLAEPMEDAVIREPGLVDRFCKPGAVIGLIERLALRRRDQQRIDAGDAAGQLGCQLPVLRDPQSLIGLGLDDLYASVRPVRPGAAGLFALPLSGVERDGLGPALHGPRRPALLEFGALLIGPRAPLANLQLLELSGRARLDQPVIHREVEEYLEHAEHVVGVLDFVPGSRQIVRTLPLSDSPAFRSRSTAC
jgi:hypothetical protein